MLLKAPTSLCVCLFNDYLLAINNVNALRKTIQTVYNRENDLCNFSKRNVQFSPFFAVSLLNFKQYLKGFQTVFKHHLKAFVFQYFTGVRKVLFFLKIMAKTFFFLAFFSYLCSEEMKFFAASFCHVASIWNGESLPFVVPPLGCLSFLPVQFVSVQCVFMCSQLCDHNVFVSCEVINATILFVLLRTLQQCRVVVLVYPFA